MTPIDVVEESVFGEECTALGFKDQGKGFSKAYSKGATSGLGNPGTGDFSDRGSLLLGSGIYSRWFQVTEHSLSEYVLDDKNLPWFLLALKRLKQLTKRRETGTGYAGKNQRKIRALGLRSNLRCGGCPLGAGSVTDGENKV